MALNSGIPALPLVLGNLTTIDGKPGNQTSVVLLNVVYNLISNGHNVLYHVNNKEKQFVLDRLTTRGTGIDIQTVSGGSLSAAQKLQCNQFLNSAAMTNHLFLDCVPPTLSTIPHLESAIAALQAKGQTIEAIAVDYMELIDNPILANANQNTLRKSVHVLKTLATKHNVACVAFHNDP